MKPAEEKNGSTLMMADAKRDQLAQVAINEKLKQKLDENRHAFTKVFKNQLDSEQLIMKRTEDLVS